MLLFTVQDIAYVRVYAKVSLTVFICVGVMENVENVTVHSSGPVDCLCSGLC